MILINIVAIVAIASALLMLMLSDQELSTERNLAFNEATRAAVIARAGEASASVALARDAAEAPQIDHAREKWSEVMETNAPIAGGTFTLSVTDAQARFNLRGLAEGGLTSAGAVPLIAQLLGIEPLAMEAIALRLKENGAAVDLSQLRAIAAQRGTSRDLAEMVTLLPQSTPVNINSASERLIAAMTGNVAGASQIVSQRSIKGFVTPEDVAAMGVALPPGLGFTSSHYWVRTTVRMGGATQTRTALLARSVKDGRPVTVTLGRWTGETAPDGTPPY